MVKGIEDLFPGLRGPAYRITSPPDDGYHCIAWATGDTSRWWWPLPEGVTFWPESADRTETVAAFEQAFATLGYEACATDEFEVGLEKIALFADAAGSPTHAARKLPNGRWTSKLGELEDIEHNLKDLSGQEYGSVVLVMRRALRTSEAGHGG